MKNDDLDKRHQEFKDFLGRLKLHSNSLVKLELYAGTSPKTEQSRGPLPCDGPRPSFETLELSSSESLAVKKHLPQTHLRINDHISIEITSGFSGYLSLFNLGTSGKVVRLFSSLEDNSSPIKAGKYYYLSGHGRAKATLTEYSSQSKAVFQEKGPHSSEPERIVVIVTDEALDLRVEMLDPRWCKESASYRGAGDIFSSVKSSMSDIFSLKNWSWGLVEVGVHEPRVG